jgi:CRP-like cAMP-binding protein
VLSSPKNKIEIVEDYLYEKLQSSIQQSRMGMPIDEFTRLFNNEKQKIDNQSLQSLCEETAAVLLASFKLMTNYWATKDTYLRFHHGKNHKSSVLLEKNLAPTNMNIKELATLVGSSSESTSRAIHELKQSGVIKLKHQSICLLGLASRTRQITFRNI